MPFVVKIICQYCIPRIKCTLRKTKQSKFLCYCFVYFCSHCYPIEKEHNRISVYRYYQNSSFCFSFVSSAGYFVFLYGLSTISTFLVNDTTVIKLPPINLSSRCTLLDYSSGVLFTALIDGTLIYWELRSDQTGWFWNQSGTEIYNSYRITDICCDNFPYVAIGRPSS